MASLEQGSSLGYRQGREAGFQLVLGLPLLPRGGSEGTLHPGPLSGVLRASASAPVGRLLGEPAGSTSGTGQGCGSQEGERALPWLPLGS